MFNEEISLLPSLDILRHKSNLSHSQLLIWVGQCLNPTSPLYNMAMRFDIHSDLDTVAFSNAIQSLIRESDGLRSVVTLQSDIPIQSVLSSMSFALEVIDLSDKTDPITLCESILGKRTQSPFDLAKCNFDTVLVKLKKNHYVWFYNQHHLYCDIASFALIFEFVSNQYQAHSTPPLDSFESYCKQLVESTDAHQDGAPKLSQPQKINTLYNFSPATKTSKASRLTYHLSTLQYQKIKQLAGAEKFRSFSQSLTYFQLFATVLSAYLHRVSGNNAFTFGSLSNNRLSHAEKKTIGLFVETYPFSVTVDDDETFSQLYETIREQSIAYFRQIAKRDTKNIDLRNTNVIFNYIEIDFNDFAGNPTQTTWLHNGAIDPQHDLRAQILHSPAREEMQICFDINQSFHDRFLIGSALDHFTNLLFTMLDDPHASIAESKLPGAEEENWLINQFITCKPNEDNHVNTQGTATVLDQFREHVRRSPEAIAIRDGDETLTYGELDRQSDEVAENIIQHHSSPAVIAVCLPHSFALIAGLIATHKVGAAFVPLDPNYPEHRLQRICDVAQIDLLLCNEDSAKKIEHPLKISSADPRISDQAIFQSNSIPRPDQDAYIIFTSGSTGEPKGVVVKHQALHQYVKWAGKSYCVIGDTNKGSGQVKADFPLYSSIGFDLTITSLFVPLTLGSTIHIYRENNESSGLAILNAIKEGKVDVIKLTPSHLAVSAAMHQKNNTAHSLILGGEGLHNQHIRQAKNIFGEDIRIFNEYGPTEAVVGCMIYQHETTSQTADQKDSAIPIGGPADGVNIYLLDGGLQPIPNGTIGEIFIGGSRIADRYLHQPALTAERFLDDPFLPGYKMYRTGDLAKVNAASQLVYLGRTDHQIKIKGNRIELGEVSQVLSDHPDIKKCHLRVIDRKHNPDSDTLHYCTHCGIASNYPDIKFNSEGVCNICEDYDQYKDKASQYFGELSQLKNRITDLISDKSGQYDCMVLLSGGKDSTYALYKICEMGFRVYAVTLDNGYISESAKDNIRRSVADLNIDHAFVTTDAMNAIFNDSLKRHSSVCYGCFKTIYTLAMNEALRLQIPVIVTGLSRGQLFETRLTKEVFNRAGASAEKIDQEVLAARKIYHSVEDKVTECLDMRAFEDGRIFETVQFVDFYRYCDVAMSDMYDFLQQHAPWTRPKDTGRSTNCLINDTGIYFHQQEKGFHNYALPYSWDVRLGHKTRDAAIEELNDQIDVQKVEKILHEVNMADTSLNVSSDQKQLIAYYTSDVRLQQSEVRNYLKQYLPVSMIPGQLIQTDHIPTNINGKVDESKLPDPKLQQTERHHQLIPPSTDHEKLLCEIWQGALRIDTIGIHDNFFELGGDSIIAIQIVAKISQNGFSITPNQLFTAQTVHKLALMMDIKEPQLEDNEVSPFSLLTKQNTNLDSLAALLEPN